MTTKTQSYSDRSNAKRAILRFREKHPELTNIEIAIVVVASGRFSHVARIPADASDAVVNTCLDAGMTIDRMGPLESAYARQTPGSKRLQANADANALAASAVEDQQAALDRAERERLEVIKVEVVKAGKAAKAAKPAKTEGARSGTNAEVILAMLMSEDGLTKASIEQELEKLRGAPVKCAPRSTALRLAEPRGLKLRQAKDKDGTDRFWLS